MDTGRQQQLRDFAAYAHTLRGDEKGEAQVFLDRLFRAFSRAGYKEAGATLEMRVDNDRGGTSFADLVWKPRVLIEMKKRGADLSRHLTQAFDYWVRLNRRSLHLVCSHIVVIPPQFAYAANGSEWDCGEKRAIDSRPTWPLAGGSRRSMPTASHLCWRNRAVRAEHHAQDALAARDGARRRSD